MRTPRTPWLGLALVLALASAAGSTLAQVAPGAMGGAEGQSSARMEKLREHRLQERQARHQKHLAELKGQLQLQAPQEAAWARFTQAMQPPAQPAARPDRASWEKMTTPERIDRMQAMHAEREALMKQRGDATKALYAALSPEQQKTFDAHTARFMAGMQGAHHGAAMPMHSATMR